MNADRLAREDKIEITPAMLAAGEERLQIEAGGPGDVLPGNFSPIEVAELVYRTMEQAREQ